MVLVMTPPRFLRLGNSVLCAIFGAALLAACASSGTEPHAMTAGGHQTAAQAEEQAAAKHSAQYDPSQKRAAGPVAPSGGTYSACLSYDFSNCYIRWKSTENPTEQHLKEAEGHKKTAEKHRAASQALVDAEQRFCSGLPEADRDLSPFYHREDISAVESVAKTTDLNEVYGNTNEVTRVQPIGKEALGSSTLLGARITFRAVPGMSAEWLQRVVDCHLARNAVVGATDKSMSFCPLGVLHVSAAVASTGSGFRVDVTSDNQDSVREIVARARALAPNGPTVMR